MGGRGHGRGGGGGNGGRGHTPPPLLPRRRRHLQRAVGDEVAGRQRLVGQWADPALPQPREQRGSVVRVPAGRGHGVPHHLHCDGARECRRHRHGGRAGGRHLSAGGGAGGGGREAGSESASGRPSESRRQHRLASFLAARLGRLRGRGEWPRGWRAAGGRFHEKMFRRVLTRTRRRRLITGACARRNNRQHPMRQGCGALTLPGRENDDLSRAAPPTTRQPTLCAPGQVPRAKCEEGGGRGGLVDSSGRASPLPCQAARGNCGPARRVAAHVMPLGGAAHGGRLRHRHPTTPPPSFPWRRLRCPAP
jgi:hypothetical protein